jgi:hypothetical protein
MDSTEDPRDARRSPAPGYKVRIVYTEPEFQRRTPGAPAVYSFTYFGIVARSPEEAVEAAVQDFRDTAWRSRVGWRRCIERVTVLE